MKPINPIQSNSPQPERDTAPQPNAPSARDQQVFNDMMRQRQREQTPREQNERSPMALYERDETKAESKGRDNWDPDMPLENPSDEQMKSLQKQQRDKQERIARRREEQGRQPSPENRDSKDTESKTFGETPRQTPSREPQTRAPFEQPRDSFRGNNAPGQGNDHHVRQENEATPRQSHESTARPPASNTTNPTNQATNTGNTENAATTGTQTPADTNAATQSATTNNHVQWQGFNPPPKKAPTLGKPLPDSGSRTEGTGTTETGTAQLSGDHILAGLQRRQGDGDSSGGSGGDGSHQPQNAGEAILGMLQQNTQSNDVGKVQATKSAQMISDIAEKIVDRILVSNTSMNNSKDEVRLMIKNSVLPETEVRISRHGGQLEIQLVTKDTDAYRLLNERADGLQHFLKERLRNSEVNVRLQFDEAGAEAGNNHSGRDGDGRSRNRRNLADEVEGQEEP